MIEFNIATFAERLVKLPVRVSPPESGMHNRYLQENVFDALKQNGKLDLRELDCDAFTYQDVTPKSYCSCFASTQSGWAKTFNRFVKDTGASSRKEPTFF